jgi:hypothetical protein
MKRSMLVFALFVFGCCDRPLGMTVSGTDAQTADSTAPDAGSEAGPAPECTVGNPQECYTASLATLGVGQCKSGFHRCIDGKRETACTGAVTPNPDGEICGDGIDNDCNGKTDENCSFEFCKLGGSGITEGCCAVGTAKFPTDYEKPLSPMLIKSASFPIVYYYGSNGKRYVFPNRDAIVSWYESFDSENLLDGKSDICRTVREFPDSVLADITIGGNVNIRPGTYIVKTDADPQMYVISRHATIRRLKPNGLAMDFYPTDWMRRVRVVPDAFFVNYKLGPDVTFPAMYDSKAEWDWGAPSNMERELGIIP